MCPNPPQTKHFLFIITLSLFSCLLLSHVSYHLYFFSAFLSSFILIFSTFLYLSSILFFSSSSSLSFLLLFSSSSYLSLYSLFLFSLFYSLPLSFLFLFIIITNVFCNSNIYILFSITVFNNLVTSSFFTSLINPFIFTWLILTIPIAIVVIRRECGQTLIRTEIR